MKNRYTRRYTRKQIAEAISHWQKILEDMDAAQEDASRKETVKIPSTPSEEEEFIKWADSNFGGSAYDNIVSNEPEEVEGAQRDLDDFDMYEYSQQDALDEEDFWEKIFEKMHEDFEDGQEIQANEIIGWLENEGETIAVDAFENFDAGEEYCTHVGHYKPESYWRS